MADLLINNSDAFATYGVIMGDGFIDAIDTPAGLKGFIEFDSRTQDGKVIRTTSPKVSARDLTLKFRIFASDTKTVGGVTTDMTIAERQADLQTKKTAFLSMLQTTPNVTIEVPALNDNKYHLVYTGQSITYSLSMDRTTCIIGAKFTEPNPTIRV